MSGQPYRYPSDPEKYRNQYLETLNLRANIDKTNFDANKVYKATGQLPAVTQLADMRTTTEKLADIQGTRIALMKDLEPIADSSFAQLIVQKIEQSPLNADGSFYTFVVQRAPELVKNIQKNYKYKIKGDMNDAETLVKFFENAFASTKDLTTSIKSYFNNTKDSRLTATDLDELQRQYNAISAKLVSKVDINLVPGNNLSNIALEITRKFGRLRRWLNSAQYNQFNATFPAQQYLAGALPANQLTFLQNQGKDFIELIEKLPKSIVLQTLLIQLDKSLLNQNPQLSVQILENLNSLLPEVPQSLYQPIPPAPVVPGPPAPQAGAPAPALLGPVGAVPALPAGPAGPNPVLNARVGAVTNMELQQVCQAIGANNNYNPANIVIANPVDNATYAGAYAECMRVDGGGMPTPATRQAVYEVINISGMPTGAVAGLGIRRRGRPRGSGISKKFIDRVDKTQGIPAIPRFISFGKHFINTKKLNDDIISIKRKSGANIKEFPSLKVSNRISRILKEIIGGKVIDEASIKDLSNEERIYLHKLAKYSDIQDRLNITSPSKDQEEKEYNQFEIMKGEILSGNDSKELVKKFKALILKFSREGKLPKGQVTEILTELVELGY